MASVINASSSGAGGLVSSGDSSGVLQLQNNGSTSVTLDTSGNVGIGTNSPSQKLEVAGNAKLTGTNLSIVPSTATSAAYTLNTNTGGNFFLGIDSSTGASFTGTAYGRFLYSGGAYPIMFLTNDTERMRIDTSGNLLVGTTTRSNDEKFTIYQNAAAVGISVRSLGSALGNYESSDQNHAAYWTFGRDNQTTGNFVFASNGSQKAAIDTGGNLLVGATATIASERLNLTNGGTTLGMYVKYTTAPNGSSNEFIYCGDSSTARAYIKSNGGFANYSANNTNLSDAREKKNIELSGNYLDKICAIPVKTFLYNDQTDTDLNLGAIAQDVQAVCPELVMESNWANKDEPEKMRLSIYQTDLQYALMKSIQELKALNDTQAETINALTARIVALEQA